VRLPWWPEAWLNQCDSVYYVTDSIELVHLLCDTHVCMCTIGLMIDESRSGL
jgi:hypothetical protein